MEPRTLRDFPHVSYVVTVLADDAGRTQLRPDEQQVPASWIELFTKAERELGKFTDEGMECLAKVEGEERDLADLEARAPAATEILNSALEGDLEFALFELVRSVVPPALPAPVEA